MDSRTEFPTSAQLLQERMLNYYRVSSAAEREKILDLTSQAREKNQKLLAASGIDLNKIETDGYTPYAVDHRTADGLAVLPVGNKEGYLLVRNIAELERENRDNKYRWYPVLNGKVDRRVYIEKKNGYFANSRNIYTS